CNAPNSAAVDSELMAKGWNPAPDGAASVAAFGSTQVKQTLQTFYDGLGGGWFWRGFRDGIATTTVEYTPVGTLVVDIFDSQTKKLVWRGKASDTVSEKPEKNEKKLDKAVKDMFDKIPAAGEG